MTSDQSTGSEVLERSRVACPQASEVLGASSRSQTADGTARDGFPSGSERKARLIWLWLSKPFLGPILGQVNSPPALVYFSGDWDVHWGYGLWILTHGLGPSGDPKSSTLPSTLPWHLTGKWSQDVASRSCCDGGRQGNQQRNRV